MTIFKHIALGALAAAALAIAPATAEAALQNQTQTWCKQKTAEDQVLASSASASLIFKADGDLVLQPLNHVVSKIWSSGTAGTGHEVCWDESGTLTVRDAAGAPRWSKGHGAPSIPDPGTATYSYRIVLRLFGCDLSARYTVYRPFSSGWSPFPVDAGVVWTRAATCPAVSQSVVGDDWCFDSSVDRELLQSAASRLVWKAAGHLALYGTGIAAGKLLWSTVASGAGAQICFHPDGRLAITNAAQQPIWQTTAGSTTTTSHLLELDECDLRIRRADGSGTLFSSVRRCPQASVPKGTAVDAGSSDRVLAENNRARLAFQPDGNLVLRSLNGDEVWHSGLPPGVGKDVVLQDDGNLVIYSAVGPMGTFRVPVWSSGTHNQGVDGLELEGCGFSLKAGTEIRWSRGFPACPAGVLTNTPAWSLPASGSLTILRTPESRLVWQGDGNLVLYSASGVASWASNTNGTGKALSFQPDGNLVIYRAAGPSAPAEALWSSNTWYAGGASRALRLGDHCTLTITDLSGVSTKWLGNDTCILANYTFERMDGDSTLGVGVRTHLTAKYNGAARLDSMTAIDAEILGERVQLFAGSGSQAEGDTGLPAENTSVTIRGESAPSINAVYEETFFERSQTFSVGPVPVFVRIGATGRLQLGATIEGGALKITPGAGIYATVAAGVGGDCDVGGAEAGIRGTVKLLELELPIGLRLFFEGGAAKFQVTGDLEIATLSGSLELYAEAYVKICSVKVSADWSKKLFGWDGVEWTKRLFEKTGSF